MSSKNYESVRLPNGRRFLVYTPTGEAFPRNERGLVNFRAVGIFYRHPRPHVVPFPPKIQNTDPQPLNTDENNGNPQPLQNGGKRKSRKQKKRHSRTRKH